MYSDSAPRREPELLKNCEVNRGEAGAGVYNQFRDHWGRWGLVCLLKSGETRATDADDDVDQRSPRQCDPAPRLERRQLLCLYSCPGPRCSKLYAQKFTTLARHAARVEAKP
jgi:hypothetical protein